MADELLTSGQICARYNITRAGLQKWQADPTFPAAVEPGPNHDHRTRRAWKAGQIAEWRKSKLEQRHKLRRNALTAYARRAGEHGHLTATAHAYGVDVGTLRAWIKTAGLELPSETRAA